MKFIDLAEFTPPDSPGVPGLNFESEDGRWRVAALRVAGDPNLPVALQVTEWAIYQGLGDHLIRRLQWLNIRTAEEGYRLAEALSILPATGSLHVARLRTTRAALRVVEVVTRPVRAPLHRALLALQRSLSNVRQTPPE